MYVEMNKRFFSLHQVIALVAYTPHIQRSRDMIKLFRSRRSWSRVGRCTYALDSKIRASRFFSRERREPTSISRAERISYISKEGRKEPVFTLSTFDRTSRPAITQIYPARDASIHRMKLSRWKLPLITVLGSFNESD